MAMPIAAMLLSCQLRVTSGPWLQGFPADANREIHVCSCTSVNKVLLVTLAGFTLFEVCASRGLLLLLDG